MNMWHIPSLNTPFIASSKRGFSRSLFLTSSSDTDCFLTVPTLRRFLSLRSMIWYDENEKVFIVPTLRRRWRDSTVSAPELSGPHAGTYFFLHQPLGPYRPSMHLELSGDDWGSDTPPRPGIRERERKCSFPARKFLTTVSLYNAEDTCRTISIADAEHVCSSSARQQNRQWLHTKVAQQTIAKQKLANDTKYHQWARAPPAPQQ